MAKINIWYHYEGRKPEIIDSATNWDEAIFLEAQYTSAFGCAQGQHRYGKDMVWAGRRIDEPGTPVKKEARYGSAY